MRRTLHIAVLVASSVALAGTFRPVMADVELTLLAGYRAGGAEETLPIFCITTPCPSPLESQSRDSESYGLIVDIPIRDQLLFEILLSHQSTDFEFDGAAILALELIFPLPNRFDLTHFQVGLLRQWQARSLTPFAAVGVGIAQLESIGPLFGRIEDDRLSASLAGGLKLPVNERLGVRLEGRGYWTDLPAVFDEDLVQLEMSAGLLFKW